MIDGVAGTRTLRIAVRWTRMLSHESGTLGGASSLFRWYSFLRAYVVTEGKRYEQDKNAHVREWADRSNFLPTVLRYPAVVSGSRTCIVQLYTREKNGDTSRRRHRRLRQFAQLRLGSPIRIGEVRNRTPKRFLAISMVGDERKWRVKVGTALKRCEGTIQFS